jgi:hypothetical protein
MYGGWHSDRSLVKTSLKNKVTKISIMSDSNSNRVRKKGTGSNGRAATSRVRLQVLRNLGEYYPIMADITLLVSAVHRDVRRFRRRLRRGPRDHHGNGDAITAHGGSFNTPIVVLFGILDIGHRDPSSIVRHQVAYHDARQEMILVMFKYQRYPEIITRGI